MALFLSTHVNKVDKKGRVSVPAQFRTAVVGQSFPGIVAFRSFSLRVIDAAGIDRMEKYSAEIDTLEEGAARYEEVRAMLADARQLAFDGEGRIVLPADLASSPTSPTSAPSSARADTSISVSPASRAAWSRRP